MKAVKGGALMGTIQKSSEWEQKTSVKKGNAGEKIVRRFLEKKGFIVYQPVTEDAHAFDMLAIKNKEIVIIGEVKTKALMNKWSATGFNDRNFKEYKRIYEKYKIPIFIFFVDEHKKEIYGNWLMECLEEPQIKDGVEFPKIINTRNGSKIRLYHYEKMKHIAYLEDNDVRELIKHTRRSYSYA